MGDAVAPNRCAPAISRELRRSNRSRPKTPRGPGRLRCGLLMKPSMPRSMPCREADCAVRGTVRDGRCRYRIGRAWLRSCARSHRGAKAMVPDLRSGLGNGGASTLDRHDQSENPPCRSAQSPAARAQREHRRPVAAVSARELRIERLRSEKPDANARPRKSPGFRRPAESFAPDAFDFKQHHAALSELGHCNRRRIFRYGCPHIRRVGHNHPSHSSRDRHIIAGSRRMFIRSPGRGPDLSAHSGLTSHGIRTTLPPTA